MLSFDKKIFIIEFFIWVIELDKIFLDNIIYFRNEKYLIINVQFNKIAIYNSTYLVQKSHVFLFERNAYHSSEIFA